MDFLRVNYDGITYSNSKLNVFGEIYKIPVIFITEVPTNIVNWCKLTETDETLDLELGDIIFDVFEEDPVFTEQSKKVISFNKKTLKATGEKIEISDFEKANSQFNAIFGEFLEKIITLNENLVNHLQDYPKYLKGKVDSKEFKIVLKNYYNLMIFNLSEYEKIVNSDSCSILEANLSSKDFSIEEASKLSQAMGLPKFALNIIKELDLEECLNEIKTISKAIDGNSLKIIFKFIEYTTIIFKKNYEVKVRASVMKKFLSDIQYCLTDGYKVTDLLNYLLRQNMYYTVNPPLGFPSKEAMYLADYIKMSKKYKIAYEKYPSQLKRQHDILSKNVISLENNSEELEEAFTLSVDKYKEVAREIKIKDGVDAEGNTIYKEYLFLVPRCIKDIIDEGTDLHHCVSSYSDRIINGFSRIVFLREKNSPRKSWITIDIDEDYNLVEAKKAFNEELDASQQKIVDTWLKKIKM